MRPMGCRALQVVVDGGVVPDGPSTMGVRAVPGQTALTRMPWAP